MNNYSKEHMDFLRNIKNKKIIVCSIRILIIMSFIIIWHLLSQMKIINTFLFSSPMNILKTFWKLTTDGELFKHLSITVFEICVSFIFSSVIGFIIASVFWGNKMIHKIFEPFISIFNSLPKVALGPLIIIWFGAGFKSIVFMSLMISVFITIINIYQGFINTSDNYIAMVKSFGAKKWQIFRYVVVPSNYPNIISTLKINISMNFIGVIMGELLVSKKGLGYLIMYGSQVFNIDLVITCIIILGIISYITFLLLNKIK